MRYYVTLADGAEIAVDVVKGPGGRTEVRLDGEPVEVDAVEAGGAVNVRVGERVFDLWLERADARVACVAARRRGRGPAGRATVESDRQRLGAAVSRPGAGGGGRVTAPMPGRVVKLLVQEGDVVEKGGPVVVVEAMKMENELSADAPGRVTKIAVSEGQNVEGGATLVELGPLETA